MYVLCSVLTITKKKNYLEGGQWWKVGIKKFAPFVVSGSSPVVAYMMAIGGLHGR